MVVGDGYSWREVPFVLPRVYREGIESKLGIIQDEIALLKGLLTDQRRRNTISYSAKKGYILLVNNYGGNDLDKILRSFESVQEFSLEYFGKLYKLSKELREIQTELEAYEILNFDTSELTSRLIMIKHDLAELSTKYFDYRYGGIKPVIEEYGANVVSESINWVMGYKIPRISLALLHADREYLWYYHNIRI